MNVDEALCAAGGGKFRIILLGACFQLNTLFASNLFLMPIIGASSDDLPNGLNHSTIVSEWNLSPSHQSLITGCFAAGISIGAVASGQLADIYGRKPILIINFVLMTVALLISAFASGWQVFLGERFATGFFQGGAMISNFLILYESTENMYAGIIAIFYLFFRAIGIFQIALLGFLLPTWRLVIIVLACLGVGVPFSFYFLLPESCRWSYAVGNTDKAEDILIKIAKTNKKDECDFRLAREINRDEIAGVRTLNSLLRISKLRRRLFFGFCVWLFASTVYYGSVIEAPGLDFGIYARLALSASLELPVYSIIMFQIFDSRFGRMGTVILNLCLATTGYILIVLTSNATDLPVQAVTLFQVLARVGATGSFLLIFLYTSEMFPTQVRGVAIGLMLLSASAGAIISYYIRRMDSSSSSIGFAAAGLLGSVLALLLPKTVFKPFPSMIEFSVSYQGLDSDSDEYSINDGAD